MKTIILIILFISLHYCQVYAQHFNWINSYNGAADYDKSKCIINDGDGNIYAVGEFTDSICFGNICLVSKGWTDIYIAKFNPLGEILWAKREGGVNSDYVSAVTLDSSNNIYISGDYQQTIFFGQDSLMIRNTNQNVYVAKYNETGELKWAKTVVKGGNDLAYVRCYAIAIDRQDNIIITGSFIQKARFDDILLSTHYNHMGGLNNSDYYIASLNQEGNINWAQQSISVNTNNVGYDIAVSKANDIYLTGTFTETAIIGDSTVTSKGNSDIFVTKYDSNGNSEWVVTGGGKSIDYGHSLIIDNNDHVIVSGIIDPKEDISWGKQTYSEKSNHIFVSKLNEDGDVLWFKTIIGEHVISSLAVNNENDIFLAGSFGENTNTIENLEINNNGSLDVFISKFKSDGRFLWIKTGGGPNSDFINSISTFDKYIYFEGSYKGSAYFGEKILQSDSEYGIFIGCIYDDFLDAVQPSLSDITINYIYPNPTNSIVYFNIGSDNDAKICVYNSNGKLLFTNEVNNPMIKIDLSNYNSGIYLITIKSKDKVTTKRIIKK